MSVRKSPLPRGFLERCLINESRNAAEPGVNESRAGGTKDAMSPKRDEHVHRMHELLDLVQQDRTFFHVDLARLAGEQGIDFRVAAIGVRRIRKRP